MRPQDIDESFPIAGQDNESAGFRDNFSAIKDSLEYTSTNLATLETITVKKSEENIFDSNASLRSVKLVNQSEQVKATRTAITQATGQEINYSQGAYHAIVLGNITGGGNIFTLDLAGFPAVAGGEQGRFARLKIDVILGQGVTPKTLTLANPAGTIKYDGSWPVTLSITSQTQPVSLELWSYDAGATVFANYLGTFGAATRVKTFESITANGNVVLGNDQTTDTVKFLSIPQLPIFTSAIQRDAIVIDIGQMIYNLETNTVDVVCKGSVDIRAGDFVTGRRYVIMSVSGSDFGTIGASSSTVGIAFTATGAGNALGDGIARELVWKSITPI